MEARVKRMVNEYIELGDRLYKATIFTAKVMNGMELPEGMTRDDFALLDKQRVTMDEYHRILHERLFRAGVDMKNQPELSFGQKLVGADFNPSGDDKVKRLKQLAAEMADIVHEHREGSDAKLFDPMFSEAALVGIKSAAMFSVSLVTNKH
jgi:hypothetical protein